MVIRALAPVEYGSRSGSRLRPAFPSIQLSSFRVEIDVENPTAERTVCMGPPTWSKHRKSPAAPPSVPVAAAASLH